MTPYRRHNYVFTQMMGSTCLPVKLSNQHAPGLEEIADVQAYIRRIAGISLAIEQLLERAQISAPEGVIEQSIKINSRHVFRQAE